MHTVEDVCQRIAPILPDKPICVETGTMYTCPPGNEPHNTTSNIMQYICGPLNGTLYSLDIDPEHINFSKNFCSKYDGKLVPLLGDSVESLKRLANSKTFNKWVGDGPYTSTYTALPVVDLLCLDGKEFDEDHMVNEFNAIKEYLKDDKHFVLVDDIHNPNSVKWKKTVPILKELGYSYVEVPTPTGMFVAWKGYDFK